MANLTFLSFPSDRGDKILGIKNLRTFSGMGLKEAKEAIEDLQEGRAVTVPFMVNLPGADACLHDFIRIGAVAEKTDPLEELIQEALTMAVEKRRYSIVEALAVILHENKFDRPY